MRLYKILSALLDYPGPDLLDSLPHLRHAVAEESLSTEERQTLTALLDYLQGTDPYDLERVYVETFDLKAQHSLHLTHHIMGEDRDRGPALIDLGLYYKSLGFAAAESELPDYLPLMLEFCSLLDPEEAAEFLSGTRKVLTLLAANLEESESPWAPLIRLLEHRASLAEPVA